MSRKILMFTLAAALLPGLLFAQEKTTVYKTQGADGVNVYSQIDLGDGQAQLVQGRDPALPAEAAKPKTETEVACERARANLALLDSDNVLQRDKDGDGTPENLTPEERATEKDLTQRQVTAYCTPMPES